MTEFNIRRQRTLAPPPPGQERFNKAMDAITDEIKKGVDETPIPEFIEGVKEGYKAGQKQVDEIVGPLKDEIDRRIDAGNATRDEIRRRVWEGRSGY